MCLVCNDPRAASVRDGIFREHFWSTAAAVLAPFGVLFAMLLALHLVWGRK